MASVSTPTANRAEEKDFREQIQAVGLDWRGVKRILPDWAESATASKAGRAELRGFILRHFGLSLNTEGKLARAGLPKARFKTKSGTSIEQVDAARTAATACSRIVARAVKQAWKGIADDPAAIRAAACGASLHKWVDLRILVDQCWSAGIPVLYLPSLPTSGRKMEGMVTFVRDRPVIVLSKKSDHPDWMVFILAHELGHIALRHLSETDGEAIVDDTVETSDGSDTQEVEANKFAMSILTPTGGGIKISQRIPPAAQLAEACIKFGKEHGISPGHVILNAVRNTTINGQSLFPLGAAALKHLPKDITGGTPAEICSAAARKHLNFDLLKPDSIEYLEKLRVI